MAICVLAVAGASEALPLARSTAAAELPLMVLPCAPSASGPLVMLGRRAVIRQPSGGQPLMVPGRDRLALRP